MTPSDPNNSFQPREQLDAYLEGTLSAEQRAWFEQALRDDSQLQRELALQSRIEGSLQRRFKAPVLPADFTERLQSVDEASVVTPAGSREVGSLAKALKQRRTLFAVLAACFAWVVVGWSVFSGPDDGYQQVALHEIYQRSVDGGFEPDWVCSDDRQFAETFQKRQGQALLLKPIPGGEMVGLAYLKGMTRRTTAMLAYVEKQPVLVFVERAKNDTNPEEPSWWSGLNLFRQELGDLVLYEVSPLSEARVLDYFYSVDELPAAAPDTPAAN